MTQTYVSAADRDVRYITRTMSGVRVGHLILGLTSLIAVMAIGLSYMGRLRVLDFTPLATASPVNLNAISNATQLEGPLQHAFTNAAVRKFAAQSLFDFVDSVHQSGGSLPNVGTIAKATVTAEAIERAGLDEYRERLRLASEETGKSSPAVVPIFTAGEVAALKPYFVVRTVEGSRRLLLIWSILYFASVWLLVMLWEIRDHRGDLLLLAAAHMLTAIGFAALLSRGDPLRDTLLFVRYAQVCIAGVALVGLLSFLDFRKASFLRLSYVPLLGALLLSCVLIVFGSGPGSSGAKVNLGPVQPVEAIRLLLALFLAGYFARHWELLRQIDGAVPGFRKPSWLHVPRMDYVMPVLIGVTASLAFFFLQKDLGPALFVSCVFLVVYTVARNRLGLALGGFAVLVLGFYLGYALNISSTLAARVHMWMSPWDNSVRGGDQVAQSLWSLSTGGAFGTGLGMGDTRYLPAGHTDLIVAGIGEELGFAGLFLIAAIYAVIAVRGFRVARGAANDYGFFLATTVTLFLIVPALIMAAGSLGVIPLTGVVTPFLSYGGSAMLANFAGLGILTAIRAHSVGLQRRSAETGVAPAAAPFVKPVRYLQSGLAAAAVALLAVLFNVQVVSADRYVVQPHLSLQADGGRRYQYNPRVLDVARMIPRGTIYDREGLPLATSSVDVLRKAGEDFKRATIPLDASCAQPFERCYPLGGMTFHLLGDARSRANWTASNTSYIERDAESTLRGFNDNARVVESVDASGKETRAIRRDYDELVPLLRHRYQPQHIEWKKFLSRPKDVHLTIDARLQTRVAAVLSAHAKKSAVGRAAAVVLDPDTGELLAAVSYPFPTLSGTAPFEEGDESILDRARYGLYPPGSTFKLVTAAAALRRDFNLSRATYTCTGLPHGRVGAMIPGWGTVRDDELDAHPHGTIDMHEGMVHSCNAYFAQLAVRLGPQALLETAARLGISVAPSNSVEKLKQTLPQAGYGQGYVITSPLRMARVAAAIASDGVLREVRIDSSSLKETSGERLLSPEGSALLRRYMRDVVLEGTGRSLRNGELEIAGKTGTAELKGSPSHAWFVGFAPYDGKKKIAFAVIVENAGYGGLAAAPVAGDIVKAAASLGLIE